MTEQNNTDITPMPRIGDPAPAFIAETTQGEINFPADYAGKWVILFSHPADFTPVVLRSLSLLQAWKASLKMQTVNWLDYLWMVYTATLHGSEPSKKKLNTKGTKMWK
jgi:hypothetical protein